MKKDDSELFEKMHIAGKLAARTLDELTSFVKPGVTTDFFDNEQVEHLVATGRVTVITDFEEEGVTMLFPRGSYYLADAKYRESYMTYLRRGLELERFVKSMHEKFEGLFTEFTGTSYRYTENGIIEE